MNFLFKFLNLLFGMFKVKVTDQTYPNRLDTTYPNDTDKNITKG